RHRRARHRRRPRPGARRTGAAELKALGSVEPLEARRSMALGSLARQQTTLALVEPREATPSPARRLELHVHLTAAPAAASAGPADEGTGWAFGPTATLDEGNRLALLHQVKDWCRDTHTEVRILPVIDLNDEITSTGYAPSPRLRRQVQLRDRTCVFPWCTRPARACDLDHVTPYDHNPDRDHGDGDPPEAQTRSSNLASLCRSHHRLKTHTTWHLESPASGVFEWTSPHGHRFRRDRGGTTRLDTTGAARVVSTRSTSNALDH
ncbi:MAG: HNH endonuclease signature motif containing protein, partial [Nocardioides sp.]|uniref:HNH endonuclease signature motif containing protein n=1 Tax=Nocardioides sp. TaxID=35761 RepID=UPI003F032830